MKRNSLPTSPTRRIQTLAARVAAGMLEHGLLFAGGIGKEYLRRHETGNRYRVMGCHQNGGILPLGCVERLLEHLRVLPGPLGVQTGVGFVQENKDHSK